jgi:hypothetical protein
MSDFSLTTYLNLIETLIKRRYSILSVEEFITKSPVSGIILRHDVDSLPANSLAFAKIQAEKGIKGTYYFRVISQSFDQQVIKEIYSLGHEIGYHYETMDTFHGDIDIAFNEFCLNLDKIRKIAPVVTICMHGSPLSKFDNRLIWQKYDYHKLGIVAEPYLDINFNEVLYLTDTGRRWDSDSINVRDKYINNKDRKESAKNTKIKISAFSPYPLSISFHSTFEIIKAAEEDLLPDKIMMTFHPQRWTDKPFPWFKELVWQNVKNAGKYFFIKVRS